MEYLQEGKWCLLFLFLIVIAFSVLCSILGFFKYQLHISYKKIEILPSKESPKKNTSKEEL